MPRIFRDRMMWVLAVPVIVSGILLGFAGGPGAAVDRAVQPAPSGLQTPLVVAGIGGLGWDDVSPTRTPALWSLLEDGASAAAVTVHTTGQPACPDGGWLSLSAGRAVSSRTFLGSCLGVPAVETEGEGGHVSTWLQLVIANLDSVYEPKLGTLGPTLASELSCVTAVGPGAAIALAARDGTVARYRPEVSADALGCPLTFVDLGVTSQFDSLVPGPLAVDDALAALVAAMPANTDLLVTSVSAPPGASLQMGVMVLAGSDQPAALLSSGATRRPGVVRLLDVPPTLVDLLGLPEPGGFQGSPIVVAGALDDPASTAELLADITVADQGLRAATTSLLNTSGGAVMLLILIALAISGRRVRPWARNGLEAAFLVLAALPVSAYLVTLLRWWSVPEPRTALWLGLIGIAAVLAAAVYLLVRRPAWRPVLAISAISSAVLALDALTGTQLHWGSPLGTSPVLGNRYYGFGNTTYAVFAVHTILLAGLLAGRYAAAGRRRAAALAVIGVGVVAVAIDTWPTWGADVGGGLALVPAFVLLALSVSGARLTPARAVGALLAGILVVGGVAGLDWMRAPAQRSHAGRFVQQVLDGEAWDVLSRKIDYAIDSFERGLPAWLTIVVLVWGALALSRPERFAPGSLRVAMIEWPVLRATLGAVLVSAAVGSVVNDWGIRIATVVLTVSLPVVGLVCVVTTDQRRSSARAVARSPSATAPARTTSASPAAAIAPPTAATNEAPANTSPTL